MTVIFTIIIISALLVLRQVVYVGEKMIVRWLPILVNKECDQLAESSSHVQQPLTSGSCVLERCPDETSPHLLLIAFFVTALTSWHCTIYWWCGSFEEEFLSTMLFFKSQEVRLSPSLQMKQSWPSLDHVPNGVPSTSIVSGKSKEPNTHPGIGYVQGNQLDLSQKKSDFLHDVIRCLKMWHWLSRNLCHVQNIFNSHGIF